MYLLLGASETGAVDEAETLTYSKALEENKGAIDAKFSPDVGDNPSNPDMQRNQNHRCP